MLEKQQQIPKCQLHAAIAKLKQCHWNKIFWAERETNSPKPTSIVWLLRAPFYPGSHSKAHSSKKTLVSCWAEEDDKKRMLWARKGLSHCRDGRRNVWSSYKQELLQTTSTARLTHCAAKWNAKCCPLGPSPCPLSLNSQRSHVQAAGSCPGYLTSACTRGRNTLGSQWERQSLSSKYSSTQGIGSSLVWGWSQK